MNKWMEKELDHWYLQHKELDVIILLVRKDLPYSALIESSTFLFVNIQIQVEKYNILI